MRVIVSGSSGFIGSALLPLLRAGGHDVVCLVRRGAQGAHEISWDPEAGRIDPGALEGAEAIIHLAGDSISEGRWTKAKKERILRTRVQGTTLLARAVMEMRRPPRRVLSASGIGFYGDRGEETLTEESRSGEGFLAEVCREWEAAIAPAASAGVSVTTMRIGGVLDPRGGALKKLLPIFRLGLGGRMGSGGQWFSWVSRRDTVRAMQHLLGTDISGPVNISAPAPVRNSDFARALGGALSRPAFMPAPAFALRLAAGEIADEALLASARVSPARLIESGFAFEDPEIGPALTRMLRGEN
jgi:uncharacterized protein (TIGR01777 family)